MVVQYPPRLGAGDLSLNRPVFSPLALQSDPQRVMVVVTDASGDQSEGGGGFGATVDNGQRRWLSFSWDGSGQGRGGWTARLTPNCGRS